MRITYLLIAAATLVGCASGPAKQASQPSSTAAVVPVESVAEKASKDSTVKVEPATPAVAEYLPPPGYQKKTKGSTTVYCRSDTPVGTRFATEYCYTQADLERMDASRANMRREVDRTRRICTGGGCGGT
jgi:hypothetical protein